LCRRILSLWRCMRRGGVGAVRPDGGAGGAGAVRPDGGAGGVGAVRPDGGAGGVGAVRVFGVPIDAPEFLLSSFKIRLALSLHCTEPPSSLPSAAG